MMKDTFPLTCFVYTCYITAELLHRDTKRLVAKRIFWTELFAFFPFGADEEVLVLEHSGWRNFGCLGLIME